MELISLALFILVTIADLGFSENASNLKEAAAETESVEHQIGDLVQTLDELIDKHDIGGDYVDEKNVSETMTDDDNEEVMVLDVAMDEDIKPKAPMADVAGDSLKETDDANLIIIIAVYTALVLVLGVIPLCLCICLCKRRSPPSAPQPQQAVELQEQNNLLQQEDHERAADFL